MRIVFAFIAVTALGCQRAESPAPVTDTVIDGTGSSGRIVSLAPSVTETLFALGLGDRVAGVTRYCEFPPEAQAKKEIGGFLDPNYEAILRLQPDLVVLLDIHADAKSRLGDLDIDTLAVNHRTVDGILASIDLVGRRCGVQEAAGALLEGIQSRMDRVIAATTGRPRPRVLISAGRDYGGGTLREVYAAGSGQWYEEIIELAGGTNAFARSGVMFPALTGEGLLRIDPDVIIEMAPELEEKGLTEADVINDWQGLNTIKAVRENRIFVLTGDYVTIPGPRFVSILEDVAQVLHPDAFEAGP